MQRRRLSLERGLAKRSNGKDRMDEIEPEKPEPQIEPQIEPWFADGLRFQCTGCGKCCTGSPGYVYLSSADLDRLSAHFQITPQEFLKKYAPQVEDQYALLDRPRTYDCIFLKEKQ